MIDSVADDLRRMSVDIVDAAGIDDVWIYWDSSISEGMRGEFFESQGVAAEDGGRKLVWKTRLREGKAVILRTHVAVPFCHFGAALHVMLVTTRRLLHRQRLTSTSFISLAIQINREIERSQPVPFLTSFGDPNRRQRRIDRHRMRD